MGLLGSGRGGRGSYRGGRGRGRGAYGGPAAAHTLSVDRRPTALLVTGFVLEEKDQVVDQLKVTRVMGGN